MEDVLEFYKFWEVFGTLKEFTYVDKHDSNQGSNARERRYIINENKKERQAEKKVLQGHISDYSLFSGLFAKSSSSFIRS
jgi:hypothetical protein